MKKAVILAGVAVIIYAGSRHGGITSQIPAAITARPVAASASGGNLSCSGLESLWETEGGSVSAAYMAAEIAMAESSGQQNSTDQNTNGTTDRGYWQINSTWGPLSTYDPAANARAAIQISHNGTDWSPWVTYVTGAYAGQC